MKSVDILDYMKAILICKSLISSTFGHILLIFLTSFDFHFYRWIRQLWVRNDGQKMDEEVKIAIAIEILLL